MSSVEMAHEADHQFHPGEEVWNTLLHLIGLVLVGGACYTVGVGFYAWDRDRKSVV